MFRRAKEREISNLDDSSGLESEEDMEDIEEIKPTTKGFEDEFERRELKWWEFLLFKKEVRIMYLVVFCLGLVVTFAATIDLIFPTEVQEEMTATCGVRDTFRSDCLPDYSVNTSLNQQESVCRSRKCCWDTANTNGVNCFHRLPSLVSMKYDARSPDGSNGEVSTQGYNSSRTSAVYTVSSDQDGHVLFEMGETLGDHLEYDPAGTELLEAIVDCPVSEDGDSSCVEEMMTVDVRLVNTSLDLGSLARTHFGPIVYSSDLSEISFLLPSNFVFAKDLPNFMFDDAEETSYFNLGGTSSLHLPLVIGMHKTQKWYIIYLETDQPGSQTLKPATDEQPILTWRFLGGNIRIHFFVDSTPTLLIRKFTNYIYKDKKPEQAPKFQDYMWKYGLHLCRHNGNPKFFHDDTRGMQENFLPVDSDCVDELVMPTSFDIELDNFNLSLATDVRTELVLPFAVQSVFNATDPPPCLLHNGGTNECIVGEFNRKNVTIPDVFSQEYATWLEAKYSTVNTTVWSSVHLHDIAPTVEMSPCNALGYVPKGLDFGAIPCQQAWVPSLNDKLYNVHASYSKTIIEATSLAFPSAKHIRSDVAMVGMPSSVTFTGTRVEATWDGMRRSLRELLLMSSLGHPSLSMEACGAFTSVDEERPLMCLRWIQLAAFMPGLHFWYSGNQQERLPYKLPKSYQRYVSWAMEQKYKFLPYYKTLDRDWYKAWLQDESALPIVRPMFLEKPEEVYMDIWTQFYVGSDILVAPVLNQGSDLIDVTFPPGSWYYLGSGNVVSLPAIGDTLTFHSKVYEIPAFQRGGSVIVTYESAGANLIETDEQGTFLIKVGLECKADPRNTIHKDLDFCYANGSSHLNTLETRLTVDVSTVLNTGTIRLSLDILNAGVHNVTSFMVSGLKNMGDNLLVTLPDGTELTATDSIGTAETDAPSAIFFREKQILMLRNLAIEMNTRSDQIVSWTFDAPETSTQSASSEMFYNM